MLKSGLEGTSSPCSPRCQQLAQRHEQIGVGSNHVDLEAVFDQAPQPGNCQER
jgi:hypothetical protein